MTDLRKLGFVKDDTVYLGDSFELLKDKVLELGAHREAGVKGTGRDLREIILPITPAGLALMEHGGFLFRVVDEDGDYLVSPVASVFLAEAAERAEEEAEDVAVKVDNAVAEEEELRLIVRMEAVLEGVLILTAELAKEYPCTGQDAAELAQELCEKKDLKGLRGLRIALENEAKNPQLLGPALDELIYGPKEKVPLSVKRTASAEEIEEQWIGEEAFAKDLARVIGLEVPPSPDPELDNEYTEEEEAAEVAAILGLGDVPVLPARVDGGYTDTARGVPQAGDVINVPPFPGWNGAIVVGIDRREKRFPIKAQHPMDKSEGLFSISEVKVIGSVRTQPLEAGYSDLASSIDHPDRMDNLLSRVRATILAGRSVHLNSPLNHHLTGRSVYVVVPEGEAK